MRNQQNSWSRICFPFPNVLILHSKFVAVFVPLAVKVGDTEYQVTPRYTLTSIHTRFGAHRNRLLALLQDKNKHQKLAPNRTVACDWFVTGASLVTLQLGYQKDRLARQS